jgi:hypothetical protein
LGAVRSEAELEGLLTGAKERGDQRTYFELLLTADLVMPSTGDPAAERFATTAFDDGIYVLAFTSRAAMERSLRGQAGFHRRTTFAELARNWPKPEWRLAINAGLPNAAYIDSNSITRLADAERAAGPPQTPAVPSAQATLASPVPAAPPAPTSAAVSALVASALTPASPPAPAATPFPAASSSAPVAASAPSAPASASDGGAGTRYRRDPAPEPEPAPRENPPPRATGPTIMQKVVPHQHVSHYLDNAYDQVAGYVHRVRDVSRLDTPGKLVRGLGLTYEGSPFSDQDEAVHVIRWPVVKGALYRAPYGGQDEAAMRRVPEGWVVERPPFLGTGYAPGEAESVSEFKIDSQRLPHGAEMYRLDRSGKRTFVAFFDADHRHWIKVQGA